MRTAAFARRLVTATVFLAALATADTDSTAWSSETGPSSPRTIRVTRTFDGKPFHYRIESSAEKAGFTLYRLTYPSPVVTAVPQNNTIHGEYYLPRGLTPDEPQRPAVICMHILQGHFELVRMTCSILASHGIPAMMFKLPYYGERGLPGGLESLAEDPKLFTSALSQAGEDVRRTVDLLASRPEVDPQKIGITGISLGGIVAATAAGRDPRLKRAVLILAGGDLLETIHHAKETEDLSRMIRGLPALERAEIEALIEAVDPLTYAATLRRRARHGKVLMINASDDRVIPRACTDRLADALGISENVIWLDGLGHYTAMSALPRIFDRVVGFFGEDLPADVRAEVLPELQPEAPRMAAAVLKQLSILIGEEPEAGHCHIVDVEVSVTPAGEQPVAAQVRLIRGPSGRFFLQGDVPMLGRIALGSDGDPWMASGEKLVVKGTGNSPADEPGDPLAFADPKYRLKLDVVAGAIAGLTMAPDLLEQVVHVSQGAPVDGCPTLLFSPQSRLPGKLCLVMSPDGKSPRQITVQTRDFQATITFRAFQLHTIADDALFHPPAGLPERKVDRDDLLRIFSALFDFAMEMIP